MIYSRHKSERKPPTLPTKGEIQSAMEMVLGATTPPSPHWVDHAVIVLQQIRSGVRERYAEVDGVQLLDHVTYDDDGITYYHLSTRARELLRANGGLPWGG